MRRNRGLNLLLSVFLLSTSLSLVAGETNDIHVRIAKYKDDKICAISYTFDDGLKEHYTLVAPEMNKRGLKGTFWINGTKVNEDDKHPVDTTRVSWSELREMVAAGHEISNHGWAHKKLTKLTLENVESEIRKNDSIILEKIGVVSRTFCFPYNSHNDTIRRMASKGRVGIRTKQISVGGKSTPEKLERWVEKLIETSDWGIGMTHGITYGYDAFKDSSILWEHLDKVCDKQEQVWVGTFHDVAAYSVERENLRITTKRKGRRIIITPELPLDADLFTEPLTMVIESEKPIDKVKIKQGRKTLSVKRLSDKVLFDFDPNGRSIVILIE